MVLGLEKTLVSCMTKSLMKSIRKLYIESTNILKCRNKYIKYGNVLNGLKHIRKKQYIYNKITSFKGDSKQSGNF